MGSLAPSPAESLQHPADGCGLPSGTARFPLIIILAAVAWMKYSWLTERNMLKKHYNIIIISVNVSNSVPLLSSLRKIVYSYHVRYMIQQQRHTASWQVGGIKGSPLWSSSTTESSGQESHYRLSDLPVIFRHVPYAANCHLSVRETSRRRFRIRAATNSTRRCKPCASISKYVSVVWSLSNADLVQAFPMALQTMDAFDCCHDLHSSALLVEHIHSTAYIHIDLRQL